MNGTTAYALSKQYVANTVDSLGAVKGANCTIKSTTKIGGDSIVTFEWTGTSGTKQTSSITVSDGVSITSIDIDSDNNLVCTMSDGTEQKAKINILDNVYTKTETDTLLLDKAEKNHNHDSAYASKDTEHEHSNKETLDKFGVNDGGKLTFNGDVVTPEAMDLGDYLKKTDAQNTYVAQETGKGLSENDFTTVLKEAYDKAVEDSHTHTNKSIIDKFSEGSDGKLLYDGQSIEADLSTVYKKTETYSQTESDDKFVAKESGKGLSANDLTNDLKSSYDDAVTAKHTHENGTVLDGITAEKVEAWDKAEENVQSDWNETDDTADGFIKNKPTIPSLDGYAKTTEIPSKVSQLENDSNYLSSIPEEYVTETELSAKGYLTEHQDLSNYATKDEIPTVPSKVSELINDSNYQTAEQVNSTVITEIAKVVADAPEDLNTLKEMSDWIAGHENDASAMNSAISDNKTAIASLQTGKADKSDIPTTVAELTDSADYAKKTDLHSHDNKTVLDGITSTKVSDWDSAKTHADSAHAPSNAQANIIESVKVNNQEITPDENKAVNIDLTGYAEHNEIIGENLIPYPYAQPERTTNGITFTFADDGSVIANGTATENADFSVCVRTNFGTDAALMLKPGIYAITGCPEGGSDSTYRIQVQFGDKTELKYSLKADYGKGFVFEVTEEYAQYACQIQCHVQKGYTVTDLVFKPMLVLGSVLKEYQPYKLSRESLRTDIADVTELASRIDNQFSTASGDSITVTDSVDGNIVELGIKGNSYQNSYSGKNLLIYPYAQTTKTHNGVTFIDNGDGSILVNRVDSSITEIASFQPAYRLGDSPSNLYLEDGDYTIYCFGGDENCYLEIFATKSDNSEIVTLGDTKNGGILNFTITNSEYANNGQLGITFYVKPEATVSNRTFAFMICKGTLDSTETYEAYCGGIPSPNPSYPQPINSVGDDGSLVVKSCGKNLIPFPYYNGSDTRNGITSTVNSNDGSINLTGTATNNYFFVLLHRNYNGKGFARQFRGKTITISGGTSSPVLSLAIYDENGNNITPPNNEMLYDFGGTITITVPENACDMYSYYYCSSGAVLNTTLKPQLEVGEVATEYEPYHETTTTIPLSEPLRAIGDIKDEITYQDGKWGVLRRLRKVLIDGDTNKVALFNDTTLNLQRCTLVLDDLDKTYVNKADAAISDKFICSTYSKCKNGSLYVNTTGVCCIFDNNTFANVDEANNWFVSNNTVAIYRLATPTFEPFADQTLPYLSTYDGVTNISNDDALSAEMTVKYPTTDASGVGSRNESRIAELAKDTDDKFDDVNKSLSVIGKCKNLFNPRLKTYEVNGVTCTQNVDANGNPDGTYTINGTSTKDDWISFGSITLNPGKYKFIATENNVEVSNLCVSLDHTSIATPGSIFTIQSKCVCTIGLSTYTKTFNDILIKPMLTTNLNATYDDFVPYTGDGETLTHDVAEIKNNLDNLECGELLDDSNGKASVTWSKHKTTPKSVFGIATAESNAVFVTVSNLTSSGCDFLLWKADGTRAPGISVKWTAVW